MFDEPTENLDETTVRALADDVITASHDRTTIVLTHRPELFPGGRHLVLRDGRLRTAGSPMALARAQAGEPT